MDLLKAKMMVAKRCISKEKWDFDYLIKMSNESVLSNLRKNVKINMHTTRYHSYL